jgi:hypothetical protein
MQTTQHDQGAAAEAAARDKENRQKAGEEVKRQKAARDELTLKAEQVMATSTPTPTQEENDMTRVGAMHPDDKKPGEAPTMPPLHEQQQHVAGAGGDQPRRSVPRQEPGAAQSPPRQPARPTGE